MLDVKLENCAGIDVGKKFLAVCVLTGPADRKPAAEVRRFGTSVKELEKLRAWGAGGDKMHRSGHGKHGLVLETRVQHFGRSAEDHSGESTTGEGVEGQEDGPERQPLVGESAAAWTGRGQLHSAARHSGVEGSDTAAANVDG